MVEVTEALVVDAAELAERHALRAYDAVHLASVRAADVAAFVTADEGQLSAATALNMVTVDATTGSAAQQP